MHASVHACVCACMSECMLCMTLYLSMYVPTVQLVLLGPCPPCDSPVEHKCHCGRETKVFTCGVWSKIVRSGASVSELCCGRACNK